ncbi:MAG: hypothetical protein LH647_11975 [Leptolyngbyaceae cyanobacterium CAN_BIN12]|nr:hypothetical protein [Leptolyngbyaceae cyanobacterium CAN_BIN12]
MTSSNIQTILDYAAIAPFLIAISLFIDYCWQRSVRGSVSNVPPSIQTDEKSEQQAFEIPDPDAAIAELLDIPASVPPLDLPASTLPALAKLYSIPGSSKWSNSRKLRKAEREALLSAIALASLDYPQIPLNLIGDNWVYLSVC